MVSNGDSVRLLILVGCRQLCTSLFFYLIVLVLDFNLSPATSFLKSARATAQCVLGLSLQSKPALF